MTPSPTPGDSAETRPASLHDRLDACVHCGLCLPACPTYGVTANELDGPRGRIDLVRGLVEGALTDPATAARHLDRCLGCRACETACPSGVQYGEILHAARADLGARRVEGGSVVGQALAAFASPAATVWAMRLAWLARRTGLAAVARRLPGALGAAARAAPDAAWTPWSAGVGGAEQILAATPPRRGRVVLLPGCVMDQGFGAVHEATASLLSVAGFDVVVPRGPLCCGALHAHSGDAATATSIAERLAAALPRGATGELGCDALIVDAAGCGSHLKETLGPWAGRVADVLEWLDLHGIRTPPRFVATAFGRRAGSRLRVAYADPCHLLHAQRIAEAPRRLLRAIPDVDLVPFRESDRCCGSAGVFSLAEPELADELLRRKVACLAEAAPDVVASANPGCQLQIASGLRRAGGGLAAVRVCHVVEVLAAAHLGTGPS